MVAEGVKEGVRKELAMSGKQSGIMIKVCEERNDIGLERSKNMNSQFRHSSPKNIKSPSDTTIYAPALNLTPVHKPQEERDEQMVNKISEFVEQVRLQNNTKTPHMNDSIIAETGVSHLENVKKVTATLEEDNMGLIQQRAEDLVVEAECFRAALEKPAPGRSTNMVNAIDVDDQFFHLTCHVDPVTQSKIEQGEFVELERLLPKDRFKRQSDRLELIHRDGAMYFALASNDQKITNVRRWEQAFRIYAAVYSMANPHRSAEIWQYVYVINSAASTYVWENVANYDFTFCHLMAENPQRSWAKVYLQMWNLTMRDTIPRNSSGGGGAGGYPFNGSSGAGASSTGKSKKPNYCWSFNRGKCKWGNNCHFMNRCLFCDSPTHGASMCRKKKDRDSMKINDYNKTMDSQGQGHVNAAMTASTGTGQPGNAK